MIDINEPVEQGHDMVLNYDSEESRLGSASGFAREAKAGKLLSLPPNDNPDGDTNAPDSYDNGDKPLRDENGKFVKN